MLGFLVLLCLSHMTLHHKQTHAALTHDLFTDHRLVSCVLIWQKKNWLKLLEKSCVVSLLSKLIEPGPWHYLKKIWNVTFVIFFVGDMILFLVYKTMSAAKKYGKRWGLCLSIFAYWSILLLLLFFSTLEGPWIMMSVHLSTPMTSYILHINIHKGFPEDQLHGNWHSPEFSY